MPHHNRVRGLTLIEVLGALVLLSTLLVGILAAKGRLVRQLARAEHKSQALQMADTLLTQWWEHPAQFPRAASGPIDGREDRTWRTTVVANDTLTKLGAQQVRLDILDTDNPDHALVTVDVVLTDPAAVSVRSAATRASE